MGNRIEVKAGDRYGRLTVVTEVSHRSRRAFLCKCDCSNESVVVLSRLRSEKTRSCGCLQQEVRGKNRRRHGMSKSPTYKAWKHLRERCTNPADKSYFRYGNRGISFCKRWLKFENFLEDMGDRPTAQHSVGRIDNDGDYEPSNCRWETPVEQARNTRSNHLLTFQGKTFCIAEWAEYTGFSGNLILSRIRRGWSVEQALTLPIKKKPN